MSNQALSATMAIKRYLESEPNGAQVTTSELKEFKDSCTPEEWQDFGRVSADNLGVELK